MLPAGEDNRAAMQTALDALGDGDIAYATAVLMNALENDGPAEMWPGLLEKVREARRVAAEPLDDITRRRGLRECRAILERFADAKGGQRHAA
jgi:hypothetical protein